MEQKDLISTLDYIRNEVDSLRGIKKEVNEEGMTTISGGDIFHGPERDAQLCFLILLAYFDVFRGDYPKDICDIEILLHKYKEESSKIHQLWSSVSEDLHDSFPQWIEVISSCQLKDYQSAENDQVLCNWMNEKVLFKDGMMGEFILYVNMLLDIIDRSDIYIDEKSEEKDLLVIGGNCRFYKDLFTGKKQFSNITLCPEGNYLFCCALLNSVFFPDRIKCSILKRDEKEDEVFPFEDARFDILYSFVEKEKKRLDFKKIISLVRDDGSAVVFGQSQDRLIDNDVFSSYSFPLVADYLSGAWANNTYKMYACRKDSAISKIPSLQLLLDSSELNVKYTGILEGIVGAMKGHTMSSIYQELTKEDYLYAPSREVSLYNIFRKSDQSTFVFRRKEDIIRKKTNSLIPMGAISDGRIIERLSNNPFNIKLSPLYYLEPNIYDETFSKNAERTLFKMGEKNINSHQLAVQFYSESYLIIAKDLSFGGSGHINEQTQMECRIMTSPGLLWNGSKGFIRVNASKEHPVCYRYCFFCQDDYQPQCQDCISEVDISSEYDEDFIIYQFCNSFNYNTEYMLVAPTKEEQHAYYLKKKDEHRLQNIDLINEIREEERKRISVDLHYLKHDAAQYLSSINSAANLFLSHLKDHSLTLSEMISSGYTVEDALVNITKSVSHVTEFLKQMTFLTDVLPQRPMIVSDLVRDFVNGCLKREHYRIILSIDDNLRDVKCLLDERIHKVFANILSNAERHAFTNPKRKDYELKISAWKDNDMVILHFANNGTHPELSLTEEGFFTRGLYVGKTGHSGFGGSIIRDTIEAQGGIVHLLLNKDEQYPFVIEIKLPIYHD